MIFPAPGWMEAIAAIAIMVIFSNFSADVAEMFGTLLVADGFLSWFFQWRPLVLPIPARPRVEEPPKSLKQRCYDILLVPVILVRMLIHEILILY